MNKQEKLDKIAKEIEKCSFCKKDKIGVAVPGEGNPDADIVFLGEAPGKNEAKTGRPFIGRSGKLLRQLIYQLGLNEEDVFITSPVKYLPIYITPKPADIEHGRTHLMKQLAVIQPKFVVLLGSTAVQAMLHEKLPILKIHGTVEKKDNITFFITLHPSAALRFQKLRPPIEEDFRKLKELLMELR